MDTWQEPPHCRIHLIDRLKRNESLQVGKVQRRGTPVPQGLLKQSGSRSADKNMIVAEHQHVSGIVRCICRAAEAADGPGQTAIPACADSRDNGVLSLLPVGAAAGSSQDRQAKDLFFKLDLD